MTEEGDDSGDFWYAYFAYYDAGITPSSFANMSKRERAIIMAFTDIKIDANEKQQKKMKRASKR